MPDLILFIAFLPAALALVITPGPDMLFTMAQGLRGGKQAAWAAAAGIATGGFINATLAGIGLGALVAAAPWVFGVIRYIGVAYLLWLAVKTIGTPLTGDNTRTVRPSRAFRDGMIVNLSNPSVILFILAFIPQFVDPAEPILPQFMIYGATIGVMGFISKSIIGTFAGSIGPWLSRNIIAERVMRYVTAGIFATIAARVAFTGLRT